MRWRIAITASLAEGSAFAHSSRALSGAGNLTGTKFFFASDAALLGRYLRAQHNAAGMPDYAGKAKLFVQQEKLSFTGRGHFSVNNFSRTQMPFLKQRPTQEARKDERQDQRFL